MNRPRSLCLAIAIFAASILPAALWGDPPSRVGRLNLIEGSVSFRPAGTEEWAPATLNYPLGTGDQLWTEAGTRAEAHIGQAAVRLAPETDFSVLFLDDLTVRLQLSQGSLHIRLRSLQPDERFEVDTPDASVFLLQPGSYRIDVQETTDMLVRSGEAELAVEASSVRVLPNQYAMVADAASGSFQLRVAPAADQWEQWCLARDRREDRYASSRHVPHTVVGYEDLDEHGSWLVLPEYGEVWRPHVVRAGWAPYRFGRWAWVQPWGWTWIDEAPWGFAPFHYGRWTCRSGTWFWIPGAIGLRPVYAPALVVFLGGAGWGVSFSLGEGVGWFPLGPREIYIPPYRVSKGYIRNINTTYVKNVDLDRHDVRKERYVNRSVAGAVTVVSRQDFERAQPVSRSAVRLGQADIDQAPVKGMGPSLAPQRESTPGLDAGRPVPRPPEPMPNRRVFTPRSDGRRSETGRQVEPQRQGTIGAPSEAPYRKQSASPPSRALPAPDREGRTKAASEEQRRAAVEEQGQAEQQRSRGPMVQPDTGRRGKQPQKNAPVRKKRKLILGPNGWEWVWIEEEDTGGN